MRLVLALLLAVSLYGQSIPMGSVGPFGGVPDVTSGLIAEWRFDDGSGDVLNDYVGSNDGELGSASGADASDPDWVAQGLDFLRANNDRVRVPFFQAVTGAWTLIIVSEVTVGSGTNRTLFSQEDGTGLGRTWMNVGSIDDLSSFIGGTNLGGPNIGSSGFHSLAASYDSGTLNLYLDGGGKVTASRTAEAATGVHKFGVTKANSGGWNDIVAWGRMYNRQLSDAEVLQVHNWLKANIGRSITLP